VVEKQEKDLATRYSALTWTDTIDPDASFAFFKRRTSRHPNDGVLAGRVRGQTG
jgi:hypothetical protein